MNRFMPTELQEIYRLGMNDSTFLGGNCPYLYIETKIQDFESERFCRALSAVLENNTLLHCILSEQGKWEECSADANIEYINGMEDTADMICHEDIPEGEKFRLKVYVDKKDNGSANVHFKFSGLITDGMSMDIFLSQLRKAYNDEQLPITTNFFEYACRLSEYVGSSQYESDIEAVRSAYADIEYDDFSMPVNIDPFLAKKLHNSCVKMSIGTDTFEKAEKLATSLGISIFSLLVTVYAKVIARFSGAGRFVINIPCSARYMDMAGAYNTVGLFSNFVNIPFDIRPDVSVSDLAKETSDRMEIIKRARFIPGSKTVPLLKLSAENYSKNIIFTMLPFGDDHEGDSFIMNNWRILTNQAVLEAHVLMQNGVPCISINYPDELFNRDVVQDIAEMFVLSIKEAVETNGELTSVPLPTEYQAAIDKVNGVNAPVSEKTLRDVLLEGFEKYADNTVCIHREKEYAYSEIYRMTAAIGKRIGNMPGVVMLLLPRSIEQFVSSYAILLTGGAYMPTDISYTVSEIEYCLEKAQVGTVITCASLRNKIPKRYKGNVIIAEETDWNDYEGFVAAKTKADDICILINTSGTTGRPKSVMLHNRGLVNCLSHTPSFNGAKEGDRVIALTNYCHDMAIFDTIGIFFFGGCVVIPNEQQAREPSQWIEFIKKYDIALWESVPSFMEILMVYMSEENITEKYPQLRCIKLGGEALKPGVVSFLFDTFPNISLYSVGGPSESTIWNIIHHVTREDVAAGVIPYGIPMPNVRYHNFNDNYEECPCGVTGVMYCSGISLAKGYMGNPEETALKFTDKNGIRYYNTGDLGVRRRDGVLLILGRNDFQVKIHGKRIELSGIERVLEKHESILRAAVIYTEKLGRLATLYVSSDDIDAGELYSYMKDNLTEYMVPKLYVRADSIPLTRNGKADRNAIEKILLKYLEKDQAGKKENKDPDSDSIREQIIELFEEELDCDIDDEDVNFYEIGGNSLSAVKIAAKIRHLVGKEVSVFDMINSQTLEEFLDVLLEEK